MILAVNPDVDKASLHMRRLTRSLLAYVQDIEALGTAETGLPDGLLSDDCGFVHESALPSIFIALGGISFSDADLILLLARVKVDASGASGSSSSPLPIGPRLVLVHDRYLPLLHPVQMLSRRLFRLMLHGWINISVSFRFLRPPTNWCSGMTRSSPGRHSA